MITNPNRLYEGCPQDSVEYYKLRLLDHFILRPLGEIWSATITSAYRAPLAQAELFSTDPARAARKAKGVSQHTLGEAVDLVPVGREEKAFTDLYLWCLDNLRPWQAILEYDGSKPECIHLSIPSERPEIVQKRLLFYQGMWRNYEGTLPVVA
jgi:hypothetical protein